MKIFYTLIFTFSFFILSSQDSSKVKREYSLNLHYGELSQAYDEPNFSSSQTSKDLGISFDVYFNEFNYINIEAGLGFYFYSIEQIDSKVESPLYPDDSKLHFRDFIKFREIALPISIELKATKSKINYTYLKLESTLIGNIFGSTDSKYYYDDTLLDLGISRNENPINLYLGARLGAKFKLRSQKIKIEIGMKKSVFPMMIELDEFNQSAQINNFALTRYSISFGYFPNFNKAKE